MLLSTPIISRLYNVEVLGVYHLILGVSAFYSILFCLQINHSLISEKVVSLVSVRFNTMLWLTILSFLIFTILSLLFSFFVSFNYEIVIWSCIIGLLNSINLIMSTYLARLKRFSVLGKLLIYKALILSFFCISLSSWPTIISLVVASVISEFFILILVAYKLKINFNNFLRARFLIFKELKRNVKNISFVLPSQIITNVTNILVLVSIKYISLVSLGMYALLFRVVASPLYSIGIALKSVFYLHLVESKNKALFLKLAIFPSLITGVIIAAGYHYFDFKIIEFTLGEQWKGIDKYFPGFFLWVLSSVVNILPSEVFKHTGYQVFVLKGEVASLVLKAVAIICVFSYKLDVLYYYPLSFFVFNVILLVYYYKKVNLCLKVIDREA